MTIVSLEEAQARLATLVRTLEPGDKVIITYQNEPIARLISPQTNKPPRKLGTMRGTVKFIAPDFDAPLDDFREYMSSRQSN